MLILAYSCLNRHVHFFMGNLGYSRCPRITLRTCRRSHRVPFVIDVIHIAACSVTCSGVNKIYICTKESASCYFRRGCFFLQLIIEFKNACPHGVLFHGPQTMTFIYHASNSSTKVISNLVGWLMVDYNHLTIIGIHSTAETIPLLQTLLLVNDVKLLLLLRCVRPFQNIVLPVGLSLNRNKRIRGERRLRIRGRRVRLSQNACVKAKSIILAHGAFLPEARIQGLKFPNQAPLLCALRSLGSQRSRSSAVVLFRLFDSQRNIIAFLIFAAALSSETIFPPSRRAVWVSRRD
mmetsp:Transcript_5635/g.8456  ORF Transcript_5635/g.8456 Transcript_5635/m.8456 type:complete len:292 (-) Transcript_5635:351-1226(-)